MSHYHRQQAIIYAEKWWNSYNPAYIHFDVDCTNFISQCLAAGDFPMENTGNKESGWWYDFAAGNWSYSWSTAHSLRWYLASPRGQTLATETTHAQKLSPGDIISYDFTGSGTWQHTAIVIQMDHHQEPLVNAHTSNSRLRPWRYEDSPSYTPQIQYKFWHLL